MEFTEAKAAALEDIRAEEPDNGVHAAWIRSKTAAAERMTETTYQAVICRTEKDKWDEDYQVALLIRHYMNGSVLKKREGKETN